MSSFRAKNVTVRFQLRIETSSSIIFDLISFFENQKLAQFFIFCVNLVPLELELIEWRHCLLITFAASCPSLFGSPETEKIGCLKDV